MASNSAICVVLVRERHEEASGKKELVQTPMYFVLEALAGSKMFYSEVGKIYHAVVTASRKLRHYFEAHRIKVLTNQPLNEIFGNRESSGCISKWALELSEHNVDFEKQSTIKSQVLADFVTDWTESNTFGDGPVPESFWTLHCNWAWGCTGARASAILTTPMGVSLKYAARLEFSKESDKCTNNIAEYKAVLLGLRKLKALGIKHCTTKQIPRLSLTKWRNSVPLENHR
jgi:hypothetical protein